MSNEFKFFENMSNGLPPLTMGENETQFTIDKIVSKNKLIYEMASILFIKNYPSFGSCEYEIEIDLAKREEKKEAARLENDKKEKQKELDDANAFHKQMYNKAGCVVSIKRLKEIYSIYKLFMNKSDVFMMHESQIINHRLPSKGGRLLVFNIDLSNLIKDKYGNAISLYLNHCRNEMGNLNLFPDYTLIQENEKEYCFEDTGMVFQIDKLNENERDNHSFELELFDESYIDFKDIPIDLRQVFNLTKPIDILIAKNKVIAIQQGVILLNSTKVNLDNPNVDIILRSHNLYFFSKKLHYTFKEHFIVRNGDGEFWLLTQGEYSVSYLFKIYEQLEVLRCW